MNSRPGIFFFRLLVLALLFTGFAQMPIFARYYLADVPGFAWTADYYLNHVLHYFLAALLLVCLGWKLPAALQRKWTFGGVCQFLCWVGVVGTGMIRVLKNQPTIFFPSVVVMWVDWGHLGLVFLLGLVTALRFATRGKPSRSR